MARRDDPLSKLAQNVLFTVFQTASDALLVVNEKQEVLFFNQTAERKLGYPGAEILGQPLHNLLPEGVALNLDREAEAESREITLRRKDGTLFFAEAGVAKTEVEGALLFTLSLRDISGRGRAEALAAVQAEHAKLEALLASLSDAVLISDTNGVLSEINPAFATFYRFKSPAECPRNLADYSAFLEELRENGEPAPLSEWAVPLALRGESGANIEYRLRRIDSGETWTGSYSFAPVRDKDNHVSGAVVVCRDISVQKQAAAELQRSRQILQLFVEHAPAAIAMFDREMCYMAASRRYLSDYELGAQNITGRSHYEVFPEIPERWRQIHRRCLAGATEKCAEDPFPRASGKLDWIRWEICPWHEANGEIGGVLLFSEVITEQIEAAQALQASEKKFHDIFEKHTAVKLLVDPVGGNILDANQAAAAYYGWTVDELRRMRVQDINTLSPEEVRAEMQDAANAARLRFEFSHRRADGSVREVEVYSSRIEVDGKGILYSIVHDISDRKRAEGELKRTNERLKNLHWIDQSILRAIGTPEAVIRTALAHLRGILGCQFASVGVFEADGEELWSLGQDGSGAPGVSLEKLSPGQVSGDREILRQGKLEIVENCAVAAAEVGSFINAPLISSAGLIGRLNVSWRMPAAPTPEEQEIINEVASQVAIAIEQARLWQASRRLTQELEERVRQRTAELEASNKELEAFAYSVSHDLRAPLRGIDGFTQILEEDYGAGLDEEGKRVLRVIRKNAGKMDLLITHLLSLARVRQSQLNIVSVDMAALARAVYLEAAAPEILAKFSLRIANLPPVFADATLLRQVWFNLIANAIKYTLPKENPSLEITGEERNGECIYAVRDNGVGFDPLYADKLFRLFQRLHKESEFEGTGVGLAIVERIVARHGGRVWAEGRTGEGAVFYFSLPQPRANNG